MQDPLSVLIEGFLYIITLFFRQIGKLKKINLKKLRKKKFYFASLGIDIILMGIQIMPTYKNSLCRLIKYIMQVKKNKYHQLTFHFPGFIVINPFCSYLLLALNMQDPFAALIKGFQ